MTPVNPFQPNNPTPAGMFAGRTTEISMFLSYLHGAKNNSSNHILITGERGIGKTSLINLFMNYANGSMKHHEYENFNFCAVKIKITQNTDIFSFIKLIQNNLSQKSVGNEMFIHWFSKIYNFAGKIKMFNCSINTNQEIPEIDILMENFAMVLSKKSKRISNINNNSKKDGIIIFIDEADNAIQKLQLGLFIKIVTEKLNSLECKNIMFVLAGLQDVVEKLSNSHESSIRILRQVEIKTLQYYERIDVIDLALKSNNENHGQKQITNQAKKDIAIYSEGYPQFIQQFGFSAFEYDSDGKIDKEDVEKSAFTEGGALDVIGKAYFHNKYYIQIQSDDYRDILLIMANISFSKKLSDWIKKADIVNEFKGNKTTVNNALKRLTAKKIILKNPSRQGEYKLQQRGFAVWIYLFGNKNKSTK